MKIRKLIVPIIAVICVAIIALLAIFSNKIFNNEQEFTTEALKSYTITFEGDELDYSSGMNFMQGVSAVDEDGNDLTKYVTVSCKPTNNIKIKTLSYSINQIGYEIKSFERRLVVNGSYTGPSINIDGGTVEVPLDEIKSLSSIVNSSGLVETDDGFGNPCTVSASLNETEISIGDYVATVVAENILGDTASAKITVSIVPAKSSKIKLSVTSITVNVGDKINPADYVLDSVDPEYGEIKPFVQYNEVDTSAPGVYAIRYTIKNIVELKDEVAVLTVTVK